MEKEKFAVGMQFKSNTTYYGDGKEYHVRLGDTAVDAYTLYNPDRELLHAGFVLKNLENVTVDLGGAKLMFHGRILPFVILNCRNITFRNFSIDYDRPFYTQADILDADGQRLLLRIADGFPYRVEGQNLIMRSETWENRLDRGLMLLQPFDSSTLSPAYNAGCMLAQGSDDPEDVWDAPLKVHRLKAGEERDGRISLYGEFPDTYKAGQILAMAHEDRKKPGFHMENCLDTVLENIRLIHVGSMGVIANLCENITLRAFNMYLDASSRGVVTINADSVHCIHCTGRIIIEDCVFENMLDDAVNIHGNYMVVDNVPDDRRVAVRIGSAGIIETELYKPGDAVNVYRGRTQEITGRFVITSVENAEKGFLLHVDSPTGDIREGDTVESLRMPEIEIRRCRTGRNRPRGFLISSGGKTVIEDCAFNNCSVGVHFTGDTTFWYESGPVGDVTIRNCLFRDCGYCGSDFAIMATPEFEPTEKAPYFHRGIKVIGNTFETFTDGTLYASRSDDIVYKDNRYVRTSSYPKRKDTGRVVLEHCGKAEID